jgi:Trk K+ transport system NAD-binding subunit
MGSEMATPTGKPEVPPQHPPGETDGAGRLETEGAVVVAGGSHRGRKIARRLSSVAPVHQVDAQTIATTVPDALTVGDGAESEASEPSVEETFSRGAVAIVATADDARNLLVTQRLRTSFDADRIYVVLNDPRNRVAFELPGVRTLCLVELLAEAFIGAEHGTRDPPAEDVPPET